MTTAGGAVEGTTTVVTVEGVGGRRDLAGVADGAPAAEPLPDTVVGQDGNDVEGVKPSAPVV